MSSPEQLAALSESDAYLEGVVLQHRPSRHQRPRCDVCEAWWPCDIASLAASALHRSRRIAVLQKAEERAHARRDRDAWRRLASQFVLALHEIHAESASWARETVVGVEDCRWCDDKAGNDAYLFKALLPERNDDA
jgi:hypothetical protein